MKTIFDQAKLGNLTAKNRLVASATGHLLMDEDGNFREEYFETYRALAEGGVGTVVVELADMVQNRSNENLVPQHRRITTMLHENGALAILQMGLVAYDEALGETFDEALSAEQLISMFTETAVRAAESGFDGVQLHAGHSLFLNRFLSAEFNHRTDEYGGSLENRTRLLVELVQAIKAAAPGLHISIKLNFNDDTKHGLCPEESITIVRRLEATGLDSVEVTANNTSHTGILAGETEGYFYDYGKALAEAVSIPVIVVGGWRSVECMNEKLNDSNVEFFSLSRPFIREPDLVNRWQGGDLTPARCVSCNACFRTGNSRCVYRLKGED